MWTLLTPAGRLIMRFTTYDAAYRFKMADPRYTVCRIVHEPNN